MAPELLSPLVRRTPQAERAIFELSARLAFIEEPERYLDVVGRFLERTHRLTAVTGFVGREFSGVNTASSWRSCSYNRTVPHG
jgi:hypothetical protein